MTKRGRPPKDDSRDNQYRIRLSDQELEQLEYCVKKTGKTKAEIIREGIAKTYQAIRGQDHD